VSTMVGAGDGLSTERGYVAKVLPGAVLRELREGRVSSAAAVVTALAFTSAGYLRGKLPGATAEVRMPAAVATGAGPATGTGQNLAAQTPTTASPAPPVPPTGPETGTGQNLAAQTPTTTVPGASSAESGG
jgi:hypothetical protein